MDLAREWTAFAGALFSLMGVSLAAAAQRNADDALSWERQWRNAVGASDPVEDESSRRRFLVVVYRYGGLLFTGIGLGLLWNAAIGATFTERGGGRDALIGGVFFTVCGAVHAFNVWTRRGRSAPHFLEGELQAEDAPSPIGERIAAGCSYAMVALFLGFGLRLLRVGLR